MTRAENGNYYWTGTFDKEYEMKQYRIVAVVVSAMCVVIMLIGGIVCIPSGDWDMFLGFSLPCIFAMIITAGVIAFFRRGPGASRGYGMAEHGIWMGSGRYRADFYFDSAKHVIFTDSYIEPVQRIGGFRIYVPAEDMPFVRSFVMRRLPAGCEIEDRT